MTELTAASHQILITDADLTLRRLLEANLWAAGCEVICAASGDEAWVHLQTETDSLPALAICGAFFPTGISGLELLARIRSDAQTRRLPVLLLLPAPADEDAAWLLTRIARWDWGLVVPFNPVQLKRAIPEILRQAASPEPFLPPTFGDVRICWQWWRDRLARHGLVYPDR
jgi:two-component system phosphate regulon response regulator PhoB